MLPPIIADISSLPLERQLTLTTVLRDVDNIQDIEEAKKWLKTSLKQVEIYKANLGQVVKYAIAKDFA